MVECECVPFAYGIWWVFGFNRYMVECEFYNDTLMESMKDWF